jgi:hypothetical protein
MGHASVAQRRATGAVRNEQRMLRARHLFTICRKRLHQLHGIDGLLITNASKVVERQARYSHHRRAVERGIVEAIHQMDRPGPVVPMQTPNRPVCLAKPEAMNAAASSWRTGMKRIRS